MGTANDCSPAVASSFNNMRLIVTVGWAIYPAGYFFGYLLGAVDEVFLNVIYNVADLSTRLLLCLPAGHAPKQIPRERNFCHEQFLSVASFRSFSVDVPGVLATRGTCFIHM